MRAGGRVGAQAAALARSPLPWLLLLVTPMLAAVVDLLTSLSSDYSVISDQATMELHVREAGRHLLEVGPFSRYGWSHPGPAIYYLSAPLYHLMGQRSQSFAVLALVVNALSVVGVALVVRRRLGHGAMIWAVLALALYARTLGPHFLRDSWNPYLPVLPFLFAVVLLWSVLLGSAWALPAVAVLLSFAMQCHVGYAPPVLAVLLTTAGLAVLQSLARRWRAPLTAPGGAAADVGAARRPTTAGRRALLRWAAASATAVVLTVLMWLPTIIQQLTHHPGNLTLVWRYFRTTRPDYTLADGVRQLSNAVAELPAFITGTDPSHTFPYPPALPAWEGALGGALLLAALVAAVALRRWRVLALGVLALAVAATGVVSVSRVTGPLFDYLFKWINVAGVLLWIVVGIVALDAARALAGHRAARATAEPAATDRPAGRPGATSRPARLAGAVAAVGLVTLTAFGSIGSVQVDTPQTDTTGTITRLADAVAAYVKPHPGALVRVDFATTTHPVLVGTPFVGAGLVLALQKRRVPVRTLTFWELPFGPRLVADQSRVRFVAIIAYADGSSPPPGPRQRVLATAGEYEVYAGPLSPEAAR